MTRRDDDDGTTAAMVAAPNGCAGWNRNSKQLHTRPYIHSNSHRHHCHCIPRLPVWAEKNVKVKMSPRTEAKLKAARTPQAKKRLRPRSQAKLTVIEGSKAKNEKRQQSK
ncbi:hypothetical protein [Paenibacillus alvei]|uniref:hypothetical protein n=1 Tax=Paenibacillus alvei TaxID=44250 RepID=UPI001EE656AC|nr:hypothetical protein [Paenibacillus alvei]